MGGVIKMAGYERRVRDISYKDALEIVKRMIKNNTEIRYGYQNNIATAFYNELRDLECINKLSSPEMYLLINKAADNYLNLWLA